MIKILRVPKKEFTTFIVIWLLFLNGCAQSLSGPDLLTEDNIVKTFSQNGIGLQAQGTSSDSYKLNGVSPGIYQIEGNTNQCTYLLIYVFSSFQERIEAEKELRERELDFYKEMQKEHTLTRNRKAKNALIVLIPTPETVSSGKALQILTIAFEKLNDTKKVIFQGTGENWEARTTLKYYEYQWGEEPTIRFDRYSEEETLIQYRCTNSEEVGEVNYEYETTNGEVRGSDSLAQDGSIVVHSGGTGAIRLGKEFYPMTIKWDGKEEQIQLRPE